MANPALPKKMPVQKSASSSNMKSLPTGPMHLKKKPTAAAEETNESEVGVQLKATLSRSSSMGTTRLEPDRLKDRTTRAHLRGIAPENRVSVKSVDRNQTAETSNSSEKTQPPRVGPGSQKVPVRAKLDADVRDLKFQSVENLSDRPKPKAIYQDSDASSDQTALTSRYLVTMPKKDEGNTFLTGDGMSLDNSSSLASDLEFNLSLASSEKSKQRSRGSVSTRDSFSPGLGSLLSSVDSHGLHTVLDMVSVQTAITMVTDSDAGGAPSPPPCGGFSDTSEVPPRVNFSPENLFNCLLISLPFWRGFDFHLL